MQCLASSSRSAKELEVKAANDVPVQVIFMNCLSPDEDY